MNNSSSDLLSCASRSSSHSGCARNPEYDPRREKSACKRLALFNNLEVALQSSALYDGAVNRNTHALLAVVHLDRGLGGLNPFGVHFG